jgi:hypothetical protein
MTAAPTRPARLPLRAPRSGGPDPFVEVLLAPMLARLEQASRQALTGPARPTLRDCPGPVGVRAGAVGESPAADPVYVGATPYTTGAGGFLCLGRERDGLRACPSHFPDSDCDDRRLWGRTGPIGTDPVDAVAETDGIAAGCAGADPVPGDAARCSVSLAAFADAEVVRWRDAYQERAAIMEFDAGLARADAAAAACADVLGRWLEEHPDASERDFMVMLASACGESEVVVTRAEFRP